MVAPVFFSMSSFSGHCKACGKKRTQMQQEGLKEKPLPKAVKMVAGKWWQWQGSNGTSSMVSQMATRKQPDIHQQPWMPLAADQSEGSPWNSGLCAGCLDIPFPWALIRELPSAANKPTQMNSRNAVLLLALEFQKLHEARLESVCTNDTEP